MAFLIYSLNDRTIVISDILFYGYRIESHLLFDTWLYVSENYHALPVKNSRYLGLHGQYFNHPYPVHHLPKDKSDK